LSGEDKPYTPVPVEPLPEKTGTVSLEDNGTEYIISNNYIKAAIHIENANVTGLIRYISGTELTGGGYDGWEKVATGIIF